LNSYRTPIYRTHIAMLHWILPIERTGKPWPEMRRPAGNSSGPCKIFIYKS
jgi:hypothetical protein